MKFRKIRVNIGDLFLAPFHPEHANYSEEWKHQWIPQKDEECFLMMNIGSKRSADSPVLTALFDGVYHYGVNTNSIDINSLKVLAIINIIPVSFNIGEFKKIDNQLIPENTPYMAYRRAYQYIMPLPDSPIFIPAQKGIESLSTSLFVTGGYMYWIADYFIKNTQNQHLEDDVVNSVRVRPEAAVHRFFPEAKNNPNWVISQLDNNVQVQDRSKYKN